MLDGYSNREIADRLTLSIATIKVHRRHIYAKLNVKSPLRDIRAVDQPARAAARRRTLVRRLRRNPGA